MKISNNIGIKQFSFLSGNKKKENKYAGKQKEVMKDTFQSEINAKEINNAELKLNKIYPAIIQKLSKKSLFTKISFDEINTSKQNNSPAVENMKNAQEFSYNNSQITREEMLAELKNTDIKQNIKDDVSDLIRKEEIPSNLEINNTAGFTVAANLTDLYHKNNINEIPIFEKRNIMNEIMKNNIDLFQLSDDIKKVFPLIQTNQEEYCKIIPEFIKSFGIETNPLSKEQIEKFNSDINKLANTLKDIPDDEFNNMVFSQKYSKDNFIKDTLEIIKNLPENEQQKVCNTFGFELHKNEKTPTGYSIFGYPVNIYDREKFGNITNTKTKESVEKLKEKVIAFTQNNKISSNNYEIEPVLNDILTALPELHTLFDKKQHGAHKFDVMKHSLKVLQKITQNKYFNSLNDSDKKIMFLAALLHDITKQERMADPSHPEDSSFDAFFITKKLNLTKDEQLKLYNLIHNHEWLKYVNKKGLTPEEATKRLQTVAFEFQNDNMFKMAKIFTHSDIKSISDKDKIYPSFREAFYKYSKEIDNYIRELKKNTTDFTDNKTS